ncbi:MAG: VWA domain-containing protein, partial [Candidatus Nitrosopelagicus sp.]|nr:VWA domain-containing protein [Candidatus Nitrosopelagicus sp.]
MLNLKLSQNRQHVKCNQKTALFVSVEISPDETTKFIQRSHHVSLAIDCSGSMDGKKIHDAKQAAINVVQRLSPNDLVSIVTFETEV